MPSWRLGYWTDKMGKRGPKIKPPKECKTDGCNKRVVAFSLCDTHYRRLMRYDGRTKKFHRLSDINKRRQTATCEICGPGTKVYWRSDRNTWSCANKAARDRAKYRA